MTMKDARAQASLAARARAAGRQEWEKEMIEALSGNVMGDIVSDSRRSRAPSSIIPTSSQGAAPPIGKNGWIDAPPLPSSPPGMQIIDQMLDAQDRADRAELERRLSGAKPK